MLCVSIAAPTVASARETADNALAQGAGMAEIRLDTIDRVGVEDLRLLSGKTPGRILLTDPFPRSPSLVTQYKKLRDTASFVAPSWVDVPPPRVPPSHLVASWHDHAATPPDGDLRQIWGGLARLARERAPSVVKLAARANSLADAVRLASLAKEINALLPRKKTGPRGVTSTRRRKMKAEEAPLRLACSLIEKGGVAEARQGLQSLFPPDESARLIGLLQRSFRLAPLGLLAGVTRRAAIMLSTMEDETRVAVLAVLESETLERMNAAGAELGHVPVMERGRLQKELSTLNLAVQYVEQGGMEYARRLMAKLMLPGRAEQMIEGLRADLRAAPYPFVLREPVQGTHRGPRGWGTGESFEGPLPTLAIGMGEYGAITRLLYRRFGMPWMFCSPDAGMFPPKITFPPTAPGQFSFAEMHDLYRADAVGPKTRVFGLLGHPVAHSRGPELFNRAFAREGLDAIYVPVRMDEVRVFPDLQRLTEASGWSVTLPHKESIREFCDELDPAAEAIGAVNTLLCSGGRVVGHNTDWVGVGEAIAAGLSAGGAGSGGGSHSADEIAKIWAEGGLRAALILGAGGGARAAVYACLQAGLRVTVSGRTRERARALGGDFRITAVPWGERDEVEADLVINATPVGMSPDTDASPYPAKAWQADQVAFDMVYTPPGTRFLREAEEAGARAISGTGMFLAQAAAQYRLWLGRPMPEGPRPPASRGQ